ncbi:MAG: DNA repair protein RecN [Gemmatimonadetes bacterium]|nr:DNA repair protein RecN [Gemmatimonadota bacterium]MYB60550.1 DNA repair protein RecN [Gemmatimonadota bacterium]MYB63005.1 DNA repair protein RecN [Gemmatimonadota bacterium]
MLANLRVTNYALLDKVDIEFTPGLNVLTGETGSGKSILIGALGLILGGRAASDTIRGGAKSAIVEGLFEGERDPQLRDLLSEIGVDPEEDGLIIRREVSRDGRNRCTINGSLVTVSVLRRLGVLLVDLHGQHDHQTLLNPRTHRDFLDGFEDVRTPKQHVAEAYRRFTERSEALRLLEEELAATREREELYRFQLDELEQADLSPGEDEELERERAVLEHAEQLIRVASEASEALSEGDGAFVDGLVRVIRALEEAERIDPSLGEALESVRTARYQLDDCTDFLRRYRDRVEYDPARLEEVLDRLDLIGRLKRKYGATLEEVAAHRARIAGELERMDTADERRNRLSEEVEAARRDLAERAKALSDRRRLVAHKLEGRVVAELAELGMGKTGFQVGITWQESDDGPLRIDGRGFRVDAHGMDRIEFLISPNAGEDLKPLASIASGGEISRIMLALKVILAESDRMPTLIFDELDIGIGGRIAESVGHRLKLLSRDHQVLCITHLHQVACWGRTHFTVQKQSARGRSITLVDHLDEDGRVREIARMLAGETVDAMALSHAREMLRRTAVV